MLPILLLCTATAVAAAKITPRDDILESSTTDGSAGFVRFPLHAAERRLPPTGALGKAVISLASVSSQGDILPRQAAAEITNIEDGLIYSVDISVGTPPQPVEVIIDTGSSELWLNPTCSRVTNAPARQRCLAASRYDVTRSSTANKTSSRGTVVYGSGNVTFRYVADTVTLGAGATVSGQIFGDAIESNDVFLGLLGLGPRISSTSSPRYPLLLDSLRDQNLIRSRAFSLDLRSVNNTNGAVIFGGIDTTKFTGTLAKIPMIPAADTPNRLDRYYIYMTSLSLTLPNTQTRSLFTSSSPTSRVPVFLDSGATISLLPQSIVRVIGSAFPSARLDAESGLYVVPCSSVRDERAGSVDFTFGDNTTIRVPFADFIWRPASQVCVLGVRALAGARAEPVLGASFLRAAYVVYDQDNRNLHLAQAANCGGGEEREAVVAIGSGADAVPAVTGSCGGNGEVQGAEKKEGGGMGMGKGSTAVVAAVVGGVLVLLL